MRGWLRALVAGCVALACMAIIFVGGFAASYDWGLYREVKAMRQARGTDYTIGEVLRNTLTVGDAAILLALALAAFALGVWVARGNRRGR